MSEFAIFGGGCFWCTEAVFRRFQGVIRVIPGYAGGTDTNPNYDRVSDGDTGHAEVIEVEFDPAVISYEQLLDVFFAAHDATQVDGQGADIGPQYRSIILTTSETQSEAAHAKVAEQGEKVATEIAPIENFYDAERYHHEYFDRNPTMPYCQMVIRPKLDKLLEEFPELLKE
jgi:peptide-methionine (S)-S-oxide reductase